MTCKTCKDTGSVFVGRKGNVEMYCPDCLRIGGVKLTPRAPVTRPDARPVDITDLAIDRLKDQ